MRIAKVSIHNFRSIRDLTVCCGPNTVLIGPNNHGKSNVLGALEFFFSASGKLDGGDFFQHRGDDPDLYVDVAFSGLSDQEAKTFEKYVDIEGTLRIRKTAALPPGADKAIAEYRGWLNQPKEGFLRSNYAPKRADLREDLVAFLPEDKRYSGAAVEEAQRAYIEAKRDELEFEYVLEDGPLLGLKTVASGVLPDCYLLPAVRDLSQDTATKGASLFSRLLTRTISEMAESDAAFQALKKELGTLVAKLNKGPDKDERPQQLIDLEASIERELAGWGVSLDIEVSPPDLEKVFELGTAVHVDDGVRTLAEAKGHGLQRAMILALTRAWASALRRKDELAEADVKPRGRSDSMILIVEEPELFLHPHAQRKLDRSLRDIAGTAHHQVLVCTHSPHFLSMEEYRHLVTIRKPSPKEGTAAHQCPDDLFPGQDGKDRKARFNMAHWINPERAEMFFARRVVFVEGPTERVILPYLARRLGVLDPEVSIIDCGSKFNLPLYMEIAGAFHLEHVVVHDEDPITGGLEGDKLKAARKAFAANREIEELARKTGAKVEVLCPDLEAVAGVSRNQGKQLGKPLAALDHFEAVLEPDLPDRLRRLVVSIYS